MRAGVHRFREDHPDAGGRVPRAADQKGDHGLSQGPQLVRLLCVAMHNIRYGQFAKMYSFLFFPTCSNNHLQINCA